MQKNGGSEKHIIGEDKKSFGGNENVVEHWRKTF